MGLLSSFLAHQKWQLDTIYHTNVLRLKLQILLFIVYFCKAGLIVLVTWVGSKQSSLVLAVETLLFGVFKNQNAKKYEEKKL